MQLALNLDPGRMRFCVLGSGSGGNAIVVECDGERLLIDCGFSGDETVRRLRAVGVRPESLSGIVLGHEHADHCRGVAQMRKRFDPPVFATHGTLRAMRGLAWGHQFVAGRPLAFERLQVTPIALAHDAREPVGVLLEGAGGERMAIVADLGQAPQHLWRQLVNLDALVLEFNHDGRLLTTGPYPWPLKRRIASERGHLSNADAVAGLPQVVGQRLRSLVLYHLSRTNNRPDIARDAAGEALHRLGSSAEVIVSGQFEPSEWVTVGG